MINISCILNRNIVLSKMQEISITNSSNVWSVVYDKICYCSSSDAAYFFSNLYKLSIRKILFTQLQHFNAMINTFFCDGNIRQLGTGNNNVYAKIFHLIRL